LSEDVATEAEERQQVPQPSQKRPRLDPEIAGAPAHSSLGTGLQPPSHDHPDASALEAARPGFAVYVGTEERFPASLTDASRLHIDEHFFTESDFAYFDAQQPTRQGGPTTSTASAVENQPFSFTFASHAGTSTPTAAAPVPAESGTSPVISNFPFPQAPHSPSPAPIQRPGTRSDRPEPSRMIGMTADFTSAPSATDITVPHTPPVQADAVDGRAMRSLVGADAGFGMGSTVLHTPTAPTARTMYGTELEVDRRFGDFGFDGVASGFWSGNS
jgi:hypothetical protein